MNSHVLELAHKLSSEFITFVNKCASAYHVTHYCKELLLAKGFLELSEAKPWKL